MASEEVKNKSHPEENDFLDAVASTGFTITLLMGIFVLFVVISLLV